MICSTEYQKHVLKCGWIPKPLNHSRLFRQWNGGRYGFRQKGMVGAVFGGKTGATPVLLGVDQLNGPPLAFLEQKMKTLGQPKTRDELQCDGWKSASKVFGLFECPFVLETPFHQVCERFTQASYTFVQQPRPFFFSPEGIKGEEPAIFLNVGGLLYRFSFWEGLLNGLDAVDLNLVYQNSSSECLPPLSDALAHPFEVNVDWFKIA